MTRYVRSVVSIRIVVAEDDLLVREGLVRLLSSTPDLDVVAACADYDEAVEAVAKTDPDVVLTDVKMPPTSTDEGIRLARQIRANHPHTGVIVVSQFSDPAQVLAVFEDGSDARGYLLKERLHDRATLVSAVRAVAAGETSVDAKIIDVLISARSGQASSRLAALTTREREVLGKLAEGKSNAATAEDLFLTKRSVEKLVNSIFLKLSLGDADDVSKRVKAALIFLADTHQVPTV
ncbi:MAG TPA: response regulator transcription factor [Solirubrobacteraceae bacterium]|nr:response regulator transcription factor [Solirubrobacteraceae bacterium]